MKDLSWIKDCKLIATIGSMEIYQRNDIKNCTGTLVFWKGQLVPDVRDIDLGWSLNLSPFMSITLGYADGPTPDQAIIMKDMSREGWVVMLEDLIIRDLSRLEDASPDLAKNCIEGLRKLVQDIDKERDLDVL
jgi:hypothetical protein